MWLNTPDVESRVQSYSDPTKDEFFNGSFNHQSGREPFYSNYGHTIFLRMPVFLEKAFPEVRQAFTKGIKSISGWDNKNASTASVKYGVSETETKFITSHEGLPNTISFVYPMERGLLMPKYVGSWAGSVRDPVNNTMTYTKGTEYTSARIHHSCDILFITTTPDMTNTGGRILEAAALLLYAVPELSVVLSMLNRSGTPELGEDLTIPFHGTPIIGPPAEKVANAVLKNAEKWISPYLASYELDVMSVLS